ncbi:MAG: hypothetical protein ABIA75_12590 [Candidatus Neomarinimicrobiota bacterium]
MHPIILVLLLAACGPRPVPVPELPPDPVEEYLKALNQPDPYQRWVMNEYDIWNFLKTEPAESEVLSTLGQPDSVFTDFDRTVRILYYYIPKLGDFNSVEIDPETGQVAGFEWD